MSNDKKILDLRTIINTLPLTETEIVFSKTILNMAKSVAIDARYNKVLIGDIAFLSGKSFKESEVIAKLALNIWNRLDVNTLDEIDIQKIMNVGNSIYGKRFEVINAINVFFNIEFILTDDKSPIDSLMWGIEYLNNSKEFRNYYNFKRNDYLLFNQDLKIDKIDEYDPYPDDVPILIRLITDLCDRILITSKGNSNYSAIDKLESLDGIKHVVLEEDSFGPLVCGIRTNNGTITYG